MEKSPKVRWYQRELPLSLVVLVLLSLVALLLSVFPWRSEQRRPDAAGWVHLNWENVAGRHGAAIFSVRLRRRSDEVAFRLVAFLPKDFDLVVLDNGPSRAMAHFKDLRSAMENRECVAGVNGGFFDPASFRPNGLMIADGVATGNYEPNNWAKGVLFVRNDELALEDSASFKPSGAITHLLQTGPWLVRNGKRPGRFEADYPAPRTFLAEGRSGIWMLGQSTAITLQDLSEMLAGTTFGRALTGTVKNAVNLDGGPSSGFWAETKTGEELHIPEQTIVRNFIGIRPKPSPSPRE